MRILLATTLAAILSVPTSGAADTISYQYEGGAVDFGLVPFSMESRLLSSPTGSHILGWFSLTSGPLIEYNVDEDGGFTGYGYGAGSLTLDLTVNDQDGNDVHGTFTSRTRPFFFTVCEGCDTLFGGGQTYDLWFGGGIDLGKGVFSASIANALGIGRKTTGGGVGFGLIEDIDGDATTVSRRGYDSRGYSDLTIEAVEAPEPSLLLMLTAGAAAICARRGISRARTSGPR